MSTPEQIAVAPTNNVYTVLVAVCVVVEIVGLIALYLAHQTVFGAGLFS
jgi:hypothetical protein